MDDLTTAYTHLATGSPTIALRHALQALRTLQQPGLPPNLSPLPAHILLGEIQLELGAPSAARSAFVAAVTLDPSGTHSGASPFLQLAQLSAEGGHDSVVWFQKGAAVLRREIAALPLNKDEGEDGDDGAALADAEAEAEPLPQRRKKLESELAEALCSIVDVYMTDLSWEADAEAQCEALLTEALALAPDAPAVLQTLASVRISQNRVEEARGALRGSMALWCGPLHDGLVEAEEEGEEERGIGAGVPEFATRISLARLLMEVGMEAEAMRVLERLVAEDDQSVEAWYLGGWCLYLLAQRKKKKEEEESADEDASGRVDGAGLIDGEGKGEREGDGGGKRNGEGMGEGEGHTTTTTTTTTLEESREWLQQSLTLYELLEYEDERLREHAGELVRVIDVQVEGGSGGEEDDGDGSDEAEGGGDARNGYAVSDGDVDGDHEMHDA